MRLQTETQELTDEILGAVEEHDVVHVDVEPVAQEAPENLGVPLLDLLLAALLPQVRGQPRTVEVVVAVGHRGGDVASEVPRVEVVLREDELEVFLAEPALGARLQQSRVPELVTVAELLQ